MKILHRFRMLNVWKHKKTCIGAFNNEMVLGIGYCVIISVPMSKLRLPSVLSAGGGAAAACQQSYHLFLPPPGPSHQPAASTVCSGHSHWLLPPTLLMLTSYMCLVTEEFLFACFGLGVQCNNVFPTSGCRNTLGMRKLLDLSWLVSLRRYQQTNLRT